MVLQVIILLSIFGFLFSLYFLFVKRKKTLNKDYKAFCDLSDRISCSKAANSKYSNLLVFPNAFFGVIFYILVVIFAFLGFYSYIFYLALMASLLSLYLIYISIKIKVFCPVCVSIYVINFLMLIVSYNKVFL